MKEILKNVIDHTQPLGLTTVLVTGNGKKVSKIESYDESGALVLKAQTLKGHAELTGTFALHNLATLKGYLSFPSFNADGATIDISTIDRDGVETPTEIFFQAENKITNATYRFKDPRYAAQPSFTGKFKRTLEAVITKSSIIEFDKLSKLMGSTHSLFSVENNEGNLVFKVGGLRSGDDCSNSLVKEDVEGYTNSGVFYPINVFLNVIKVAGNADITLGFLENGAMVVSFEDETISYDYYISAKVEED